MRKIISRWAPSNENDTESYVQAVAHALGRDPDEKLPLDSSPVLYLSLAKAIARHENGAAARQIPTADWDEGARLAGIQS